MSVLAPAATFLIEHLELTEATGDPDASWEVFQLQHLNNPHLFGITTKTRQGGWSWITAAEAVAISAIVPRTTNIFVSLNQDEATEKVRYARQIIEALDRDVRPKLVIDNRLELETENGSRLISHPCRPPRGKPRARIYLDEFAHYPRDREIYQAAVPVTTRGGVLRIGSSPLGAGGLHWEIYTQALRPYPGYARQSVPWWGVRALCTDLDAAAQHAAHMLTEERVRLFGAPRLTEIFDNVPLEDFQQEYECAWVDESVAWITWEDIKRNQAAAQAEQLWYRQARGVPAALTAIDEVARAVQAGTLEPALAGGMDVGRTRDLTEIVLVGKATTGQLPYRLGLSLAGVEFDDQRAVAQQVLTRLPITKLLIDRNGLGMQLAEQLQKAYRGRAEGVDFTNQTKELWAVEAKVRAQRGQTPLPLDRDLAYQIHSIKKRITPAKNVTFDVEASAKHHADKFWAWALAVWAAGAQKAALKSAKIDWSQPPQKARPAPTAARTEDEIERLLDGE